MSILIILAFVFSLLFLILQHFTFSNEVTFKDFLKLKDINNVNISHGSVLEIIWIVIPSLILLFIAIPSFSLLYSMEAFTDCYILLNVIGHQWYWSYECVIKTQFLPIEEMFSSEKIDFFKFKHIKFNFDSYMDLKRFSTLYKFNAENKIVKTKYYNLEAGNDYDIFEDFIPQITNFAIKVFTSDTILR